MFWLCIPSMLSISSAFLLARKTLFKISNRPSLVKSLSLSMSSMRSLEEFGRGENTISKYLVADNVPLENGSKMFPRIVKKVHFTNVLPESVPNPYFITASKSCAEMLQLDPKELTTDNFVQALSGNILLPGLDTPYATVYGCHCYGQWFGQLGDGRALSIGEVHTANTEKGKDCHYSEQIYELQLKGCGRSPYSRGFDGRAVLRSSVREFLGEKLCIFYHYCRSTTSLW